VPRPRLKLLFPPGWEPIDNPEGGPTYCRCDSEGGVFQVSTIFYKSGVVPNPSQSDLVDLARTKVHPDFRVAETSSGTCALGQFGLARTESHDMLMWLWYITNGRDFVIATYIAPALKPDELADAEFIVQSLQLREHRPWWRFW
jgi:hypothetical protein